MNHLLFKKLINLPAPILLTGETGTGKSVLAKKIFNLAEINKEKFIITHLASLKEDLLESELFGYKKGAFTGANESKCGYIKEAGSGTLFLDEIGELSLDAQKKLLYLLEEKKFSPLGSTQSIDFCGRIIMATNKNLLGLVEQGLFREDLYYRICIFNLELPSLRSNPELIESSVKDIFSKLKMQHQKPYSYLSPEALDFLKNQKWKGNLRELKNALEYAIVMSEDRQIMIKSFPEKLITEELTFKDQKKSFIASFPHDFNESIELFEKMYLAEILTKNCGRVNDTARRLGMSKTTLIQKTKKYQINTLKMRSDASVLVA